MSSFISLVKSNQSSVGGPINIGRCYNTTLKNVNGGNWNVENSLSTTLPTFVLQLGVVNILTCLLLLVLRRINQPHFVAQILVGFLLGPSVLGRIQIYNKSDKTDMLQKLFPFDTIFVLETIANLGLVFYMFFIGLQMELTTILQVGKKPIIIGLVGIIIPFSAGAILFFVFNENIPGSSNWGLLIWGTCLSITSLPVVTRILADNKVLHSDIGRTASSSAYVSDICSWVVFVTAVTLCSNHTDSTSSTTTTTIDAWSLVSLSAFVIVGVYVIRPFIKWLTKRFLEGESLGDLHVCVVLTAVLGCGLATDAIGLYSFTGAFLFGLIMPNGELGNVVAERVEDFVSGDLLPLYFTITGFRINLIDYLMDYRLVDRAVVVMIVATIIVMACLAKIGSVVLVAYLQKMSLKEGTALGVLMNTKGVLAIVILNIGFDRKILSTPAFSVMIIAILIMTFIVSPTLSSIYNPKKRFLKYKRRTIQDANKDPEEFRIFVCIHEMRDVSGIINLLEVSNATFTSPIVVFALHLVELASRTSSMLIVHNTGGRRWRGNTQSDQIIDTLENYQNKTVSEISVQPLTTMSPYDTMDEDIFSLAVDKRVALIIVPFHKKISEGGRMEEANTNIRILNQKLLDMSPCSVAIFVDRGLSNAMYWMEFDDTTRRIAMIFVGGCDDREALCYAWRMARHPDTTLDVIRFVPSEGGHPPDNEYLKQFMHWVASDVSISYIETVSNSGEETLAILNTMEHDYDLYIVGRGGGESTLTTKGLLERSECPELGAIGGILVLSKFAARVSVLVVQQYKATQSSENDTPHHQIEQHPIEYEQCKPPLQRVEGEKDYGSDLQFLDDGSEQHPYHGYKDVRF